MKRNQCHFANTFSYNQGKFRRLQSVAAQPHHLHVSRTTQYLRHPLTLKAEILYAAPRGQNLLPQEISVQSDKLFQRYGMWKK